jgi:hypothetical protein
MTAGKKIHLEILKDLHVSSPPLFPLDMKKKKFWNIVCLYVCAPCYSLNGWTDFAHVQVYKSFSIINYCPVNISIPAQKTGALRMDPKTK